VNTGLGDDGIQVVYKSVRTDSRTYRRVWTVVVYLLATALARLVCAAGPDSFPIEFHVAGGDATSTLTEFSRQAHLQLLFDYNVVKGHLTQPLEGRFTAPEALNRLLANTDLEFDFVNERTLAVMQKQKPPPEMKVAAGESRADLPPPRPTLQSPSASATSAPIDMVRVTGTYLHDEIPIGEEIISASRDDIEATGSATPTDFLRTLPQTFGGGPNQDTHIGQEAMSNSGLGVGVNLRGLGARATLVLIDGRRVAASGTEGEFVDVENVPLSAIERVDILPDSASATYGADAVGGVVNFILRDRFDSAETIARAGSGTRGDLQEYLFSQTLGKSWDGGHGLVSFEFYRRGALPAADRAYAVSDLRPFGGGDFDTNFTNPGNIIDSRTGQTWAIPAGQNGIHLTAADLIAGTQHRQNVYLDRQIIPSQERWSFYGTGRQGLGDRVTLFSDVLLTHREATQTLGGFQTNIPVPSTNPFYVNPAGTDPVEVAYNFGKDLGPLTGSAGVDTLNATVGLDIDAGSSWVVKAYASYVRERQNQFVSGDVNFDALKTALADPNPSTAFNPYGDGSNNNATTLDAIRTDSRFWLNSQLKTVDVAADGTIGKLAGIPLKVAIGADWRDQPFSTTNLASQPGAGDTVLDRKVLSAFGQLVAPVFTAQDAIPGLRTLELSAAGRYENYNSYGSATTPKYTIAWSPLNGIGFRGTWSRSIRPPTLVDLDMSRNLSVTTPVMAAPGSVTSVLAWQGGNRNVQPEHAESWTAGMDLAPTTLPGLSLGLTYFRTVFKDRIQSVDFTPAVLSDPIYAPILTHNPSAAQLDYICTHSLYLNGSPAQCMSTPVNTIVDLRVRNLGKLVTDGIDFNGIYERLTSIGKLTFGLRGTWLQDFSEALTQLAPLTSLLNTQNEPVNLRMRATADWQFHGFGTLISANFTNSYRDTTSVPERRIDAWTTIDLQLRYDFPEATDSWLHGMRIELNARNVFNVDPPFLNNQLQLIGYDQENADPYGRLLSVQLDKTW
jgi:outer membrane receptor protein involved in Fe transport